MKKQLGVTKLSQFRSGLASTAAMFVATLIGFSSDSFAACATPTANLGALDFQGGVFKYCDGTTWQNLGGDFLANGSVSMTGNLRLNGNYLSNDGGSEGLTVDNSGLVSIHDTNGNANNKLKLNYDGTTRVATIGPDNDSSSTRLVFATANAGAYGERMRIDEYGYVGIGTSPVTSSILSLRMDASLVSYGLHVQNGEALSNVAAGILLSTPNSTNPSSRKWGIAANNTAGALDFLVSTTLNGTPTESALSLSSNGNVGIGGISPTAALHVKAGTAAAGTAPLKLTSGTNLTTPEAGAIEYNGTSLFFTDSGGTRRSIMMFGSTVNSTNLTVMSGGNATPNGIKLYDPEGDGELYFNKQTAVSGGDAVIDSLNSASAGTQLILNPSGGSVGIGESNPSEKLTINGNALAAAYLYSSDERLKKDIVPLENSLEKLNTLSTVNFKWKKPQSKDADREQIGLIAQDVEKVYPEAVVKDQKGWLRVNYSALISPVIDGLRELYRKVVGVDERVQALEAEVARLKEENQKLNQLEERLKSLESARSPAGEK